MALQKSLSVISYKAELAMLYVFYMEVNPQTLRLAALENR